MFRWLVPIGVLITLLPTWADAQVQPLQFEKETLPNGLRVIYAPMRQAPVVHVRVVYHAGSRDEPQDKQGLAHLFEHLMFRGSAHVGDGEHLKLIQGAGGVSGAQTEQDITTYYQTLPRNQLALALYLEADRMASLKLAEPTLNLERQIVLHELARRQEEPQLALVDDLLAGVFNVHPYRWSPQGNPAHLGAVQVADLRQFAGRYYLPNNAAMIITGDFDAAEARRLTHQFFGWIARGPDVARMFDPEPPQASPRRKEITRPVPAPMLLVGCPAPRFGSEDEPAVLILANAMQHRMRAYLEVTTRPLCASTFTRMMSFEENGCLYLGGAMLPGADRAVVQRVLTARLELLRSEGLMLNDRDFASVIDDLISQLLGQRQTVEGLAEQIGRGEVLSGQADESDRLIARLLKVTPRMVFAAAQKYLRPEALTFVVVDPKSESSPAGAVVEDLPAPAAAPPDANSATIAFPAEYPASPQIASGIVPFRAYRLPEVSVGGVRVILGPPLAGNRIEVQMLLPRGLRDDPAGLDGSGILTSDLVGVMAHRPEFDVNTGMWLHSPLSYGVQQGLDTTALVGLAPSSLGQSLMRGINRSLREELELGLLDEYLVTLKWKLFTNLQERDMRPDAVADLELRREVFADSPLGREASAASLRAISRRDLERSRRSIFGPQGAVLVISGGVREAEVNALVAALFRDIPAPAPAAPATLPSAAPAAAQSRAGLRIILVDDPSARQAQIRIGAPAFGWGSPDLPAAEVGETILSDRLFDRVRQERGAAYSVEAGFAAYHGGGSFRITTATSIDRAGSTLKTLLDQLRQIAAGVVQEEELKHARSERAGRLMIALQTAQQQASARAMAMLRGDEPDPVQQIRNLLAVTAADVSGLYSRYAVADRLTVVVVAPAARVKPQIEGFGPIEVRPMPHLRPGAATRPAYEEIPRPM